MQIWYWSCGQYALDIQVKGACQYLKYLTRFAGVHAQSARTWEHIPRHTGGTGRHIIQDTKCVVHL